MRDRDVRQAVKRHLDALHSSDHDTRIVEEMGVWAGTVRIDIAVINGELSGFELKSDRDTLDRLPLQADIYSRVFDEMTLVVGKRHIDKASSLIPNWWGIMCATENELAIALDPIRLAMRNPAPEPYLVAELLWKDEALAILEDYGLAKGWRAKRIKAIHMHLAESLPFSTLSDRVRLALKGRSDWLRQDRSHQLHMPVHA